jgi:hypothetical protein
MGSLKTTVISRGDWASWLFVAGVEPTWTAWALAERVPNPRETAVAVRAAAIVMAMN